MFNQPSTSNAQIGSDFIRAQMFERNQNEAAKYKLAKGIMVAGYHERY